MPKKCREHGIRLRNGKYCPVCGRETIALPLWPFKVYVPQWFFVTPSICAVAIVLFFFAVVPGVKSCNENRAIESKMFQEKWNHLPEPWRKIAFSLSRSVSLDDRMEALKNILAKTPNMPPINDKDFEVIIGNFVITGGNQIKEATALLTPYILKGSP